MMSNFKKERHNPIEMINSWWPDVDVDHINYDPRIKENICDFCLVQQSGGDGTFCFTAEMFRRLLEPLINRRVCSKLNKPKDWSKIKNIRYIVGDIQHAIVFGEIYLRCSKTKKYPGQIDRVRIPVKCEYVYK